MVNYHCFCETKEVNGSKYFWSDSSVFLLPSVSNSYQGFNSTYIHVDEEMNSLRNRIGTGEDQRSDPDGCFIFL